MLGEADVERVLLGQDEAVADIVKRAYELHQAGETVLPEAVFLRLPGDDGERIVALPAYVGGELRVAGVKWIASFPKNRTLGLERASATVILNSTRTGEPLAVLGGATISARRTAASATLAAALLWDGGPPETVGVVGCGRISQEILRLLVRLWPSGSRVFAYDSVPTQLEKFMERCEQTSGEVQISPCSGVTQVLAAGVDVMVIATTATSAHIDCLGSVPPRLLLHISLRDLAPEVIMRCRNVVDDPDHVCRQHTSVHLAAQRLGHRAFIEATLGQLLRRDAIVRVGDVPVVFSPFGLGVLDVAVGSFVYERANALGMGTVVEGDQACP